MHMLGCLYFVSLQPVKVAVKLRNRRKGGSGPSICMGREYSRFQTCIFKSHLLPSLWPISALSELGGQLTKKRKKKIAVKYKSADQYVGRPKKSTNFNKNSCDSLTAITHTEILVGPSIFLIKNRSISDALRQPGLLIISWNHISMFSQGAFRWDIWRPTGGQLPTNRRPMERVWAAHGSSAGGRKAPGSKAPACNGCV